MFPLLSSVSPLYLFFLCLLSLSLLYFLSPRSSLCSLISFPSLSSFSLYSLSRSLCSLISFPTLSLFFSLLLSPSLCSLISFPTLSSFFLYSSLLLSARSSLFLLSPLFFLLLSPSLCSLISFPTLSSFFSTPLSPSLCLSHLYPISFSLLYVIFISPLSSLLSLPSHSILISLSLFLPSNLPPPPYLSAISLKIQHLETN